LSAFESTEGFEKRFYEIFVVGSAKYSEFSLELTGADGLSVSRSPRH
jgi:hypothetical protein